MIKELVEAMHLSRRCQRNWASQNIDEETINGLIEIALNAPSKQNEVHFALAVITNKDVLKDVYDDFVWGFHAYTTNSAMRNTQMGAPALFIYGYSKQTDISGDSHGCNASTGTSKGFDDRMKLAAERSIGISSGQLVLAANMLGLQTGFNQNLFYNDKDENDWKDVLGLPEDADFCPSLAVGVGYGDPTLEWYQTRDLEYLVASKKERNLEENTCLDYPSTDRRILKDRKIFQFGPKSTEEKNVPLYYIK